MRQEKTLEIIIGGIVPQLAGCNMYIDLFKEITLVDVGYMLDKNVLGIIFLPNIFYTLYYDYRNIITFRA